MSTALSIKDLTYHYNGQNILSDLSLAVEDNEIVCLLGASGCGKTTLLKAIAGLLPLTSGLMHLNQRVICDGESCIATENRNIGMIFQDYALFPHLTVIDNIAFGLRLWDKPRAQKKIEEMLALVHLDEFGLRYPHQLSGGQQQRVAIARALACEPDLLLLDEPFSNIDTQVRHDLIKDIRRIFKTQGVTAIFVTHSREEAFAFSDKLAVMNNGIIEQFGNSSELYHQPSTRFVADFLGGGSYLSGTVSDDLSINTLIGRLPFRALAHQPGDHVDVLLRPQHVVISEDSEGVATVIEQQFMGDNCRYVVEIESQTLLAISHLPLVVGQRVSVTVDDHQPILF
ncbi:ABC transporter ATP-binding protein [Aliivibrio kagoshimensis]|uniref:ABC transporter ATP-binding protein n=1 Tax=Aliivibrio kagoshimensis TaxID=2910230 RepID=UPI003D0C5058